jgi:hypothetical protein
MLIILMIKSLLKELMVRLYTFSAFTLLAPCSVCPELNKIENRWFKGYTEKLILGPYVK